jgi:hypothetical protein
MHTKPPKMSAMKTQHTPGAHLNVPSCQEDKRWEDSMGSELFHKALRPHTGHYRTTVNVEPQSVAVCPPGHVDEWARKPALSLRLDKLTGRREEA